MNSQEYPTSFEDWPKITVYDCDFRSALHDMYTVINEKELWDYIKDNPPDPNKGYMFGSDDKINSIENDQRINRHGHSGATFAHSMRVMQRISKVGFKTFTEEYN